MTRQFEAKIDSPAAFGPRHRHGRRARCDAERRFVEMIRDARAATGGATSDRALFTIAVHRDHEGALLDPYTGEGDFINGLRPIVAIARFVTFAARPLGENARLEPLLSGDDY